ncbi:MAG: hypothetical protein HY917_05595, partial [Candidatus Diapherotrites archaeon]|nr:hypothetical protein [Candidatus Diapherotrites archaeon]
RQPFVRDSTAALYHGLRLASLLFPGHFAEPKAFRESSLYTKPVADETNVLEFKRKYYQEAYRKKRLKEFRMQEDEKIRERVPGLEPLARQMKEAGIEIPHPEVNFHIQNGKIVFFEIHQLNLNKIYQTVKALPEPLKKKALLQMAGLLYESMDSEDRKIHGSKTEFMKRFAGIGKKQE